MISESFVILQISYFESPLGYNIVDWFGDEVQKLEKIELVF